MLRGIDLVLEAFVNMPELNLWVCGPLQSPGEKEFIEVYREELFHTQNIHPIGWIDVRSKSFQKLTNNCTALLSTACTEGMSGGALNCMRRGVIPFVTRATGIDIQEDFGFVFENDTVDGIHQRMMDFSKLDIVSIQRVSETVLRETNKRYSIEAFAHNIEFILSEILF